MANNIKKAKVNAMGSIIEVYKLRSGDWCNWSDCKTIYKESELTF